MKWLPQPPPSDTSVLPLDRIGFDMIRAIVGARQAACATVQALSATAAVQPHDNADQYDSSIALLTGRKSATVNGGAFAPVHSADGSCAKGDECHG